VVGEEQEVEARGLTLNDLVATDNLAAPVVRLSFHHHNFPLLHSLFYPGMSALQGPQPRLVLQIFRLELTISRPVRWPCSRHLRLTGWGAWYLAPVRLLLLETPPRRASSGCCSCSTLHRLSSSSTSTGFQCLLASAGHG
jgi:hypothetical protein